MSSIDNPTAVKRSPRTVLLADSNSRSRELRCKAFRSLGADVQAAESADVALTQYRNGTFDLVLIDFRGDIEGAELFASSVRAINPQQKISFLVGGSALLSSVRRKGPQKPVAIVRADTQENSPTTQSDFGRRITEAEKIQKG
jgi:CheY-like chemotaxis protein